MPAKNKRLRQSLLDCHSRFYDFTVHDGIRKKGNAMGEEKINNVEILTDSERRLLDLMRSVNYGEMRIVINNGKPVRIEEIRKSIKLD